MFVDALSSKRAETGEALNGIALSRTFKRDAIGGEWE
jgi:hypothetical protein